MATLVLLAVIAAASDLTRRRLGFDPNFNPYSDAWDPVNIPTNQPYRGEPHDIIWDDLNKGVPLPQAERNMTVFRPPRPYIAKAEVAAEAPKVQRDPLYPDDLRAYDLARSRAQKELKDSAHKNYEFGSYYISPLAQNKTKQEVAQSETLSGRFNNQYTTGGTSKNGALFNMIDPSVQVIRKRADHVDCDRSTYQVWTKRQFPELNAEIQQEALPQRAAINEPQEWMQSAKIRDQPKYMNVANNEHGYVSLSARQQRMDIADIDPIKKKRLLLVGNQGFPSSQVSHYYGGTMDTTTLQYPETSRRRQIMPEVSNGGLFQHGSGRSFLDANTGQDGIGKQLQTRDVIVPKLTSVPYTVGQHSVNTSTPWLSYDPSPDLNIHRKGTVDMWTSMAQPTFQSDNAHTFVVPLLR